MSNKSEELKGENKNAKQRIIDKINNTNAKGIFTIKEVTKTLENEYSLNYEENNTPKINKDNAKSKEKLSRIDSLKSISKM